MTIWNKLKPSETYFILFSVPRTCSEYKARSEFNSGYYLVDPNQKNGGTTKFNVYCDFENGIVYTNALAQIWMSILIFFANFNVYMIGPIWSIIGLQKSKKARNYFWILKKIPNLAGRGVTSNDPKDTFPKTCERYFVDINA